MPLTFRSIYSLYSSFTPDDRDIIKRVLLVSNAINQFKSIYPNGTFEKQVL